MSEIKCYCYSDVSHVKAQLGYYGTYDLFTLLESSRRRFGWEGRSLLCPSPHVDTASVSPPPILASP